MQVVFLHCYKCVTIVSVERSCKYLQRIYAEQPSEPVFCLLEVIYLGIPIQVLMVYMVLAMNPNFKLVFIYALNYLVYDLLVCPILDATIATERSSHCARKSSITLNWTFHAQ